MAEKGFGVKEVNLIGASGTPTITSPNNLNLNANNVAISTNVSIGGTLSVTGNVSLASTLTVSGNVSIAGTLTYEDVTNIDSVGLITARNGLIVTGVTTTGGITIKAPTSTSVMVGQDAGFNHSGAAQCVGVGYYALRANTNSDFNTAVGTQALGALGSNSGSSYAGNTAVGHLAGSTITTGSGNTLYGRLAGSAINSNNNTILGIFDGNQGGLDIRNSSNNVVITDGNANVRFYANSSGNVGINSVAPTSKLDVVGDVKVTGVVTATTFVGSLTGAASAVNVTAANSVAATVYPTFAGTGATQSGNLNLKTDNSLTYNSLSGELTATKFTGDGSSLTNIAAPVEAPVVNYTITANGSSAYRFSGGGVDDTADDPDLYLIRGQKYRFNNTTGSNHPFQFRVTTGGSAYTAGVSGDQNGVQFFTPDNDAPSKIYYICTLHSNMVGTIYIRGANGANENVGVTTFANITANNINGTPDINVGTGELDIYSTGSGDQLSLRLLNSDASAGNKIGIYFGPANNVAGAYIKGVAESDFSSTANRDAGLEFGTRFNANFLAPLKISANGIVTKPSYHPAFRAGRSSDVNPGSSGTIVFNYVANPTHFNQGGHYSNSTGAFTAPVAGIYNFYTQVLWENVSSGQNMADAIMLYYNASGGASGGTLVSYDARRAEYIANETGNAGYYGAHTTLLIYMAANSSIYVRNNYNLTVHGNANFTFFQGYLVG